MIPLGSMPFFARKSGLIEMVVSRRSKQGNYTESRSTSVEGSRMRLGRVVSPWMRSVMTRAAVQWPNHGDHTKATEVKGCFPSDMVASSLDTSEFFSRAWNLIRKLAMYGTMIPAFRTVITKVG